MGAGMNLVSGRTLRDAALEVIKETKKFLTLMPLALESKLIELAGYDAEMEMILFCYLKTD
jgi:hypothetical protein